MVIEVAPPHDGTKIQGRKSSKLRANGDEGKQDRL